MGILNFSSDPANWKLYLATFPPGATEGSFIFEQPFPATAPRLHVNGGDSGDFLFGFQSRDEILGGNGSDILMGNITAWNNKPISMAGPVEGDQLDGGAGNDWISGSGGADRIAGGEDNDFLDGLNGDDQMQGLAGNDVLAGASHADKLSGEMATTSWSGMAT